MTENNRLEDLEREMEMLVSKIDTCKASSMNTNFAPYINSLTLAMAKYILLQNKMRKAHD